MAAAPCCWLGTALVESDNTQRLGRHPFTSGSSDIIPLGRGAQTWGIRLSAEAGWGGSSGRAAAKVSHWEFVYGVEGTVTGLSFRSPGSGHQWLLEFLTMILPRRSRSNNIQSYAYISAYEVLRRDHGDLEFLDTMEHMGL